jgi:hypothetical protein
MTFEAEHSLPGVLPFFFFAKIKLVKRMRIERLTVSLAAFILRQNLKL